MRHAQPRAFIKHLEASSPANFASSYLFIAKDPGDRRWGFDRLKEVLKRAFPDIDVQACEGEGARHKDFMASLDTTALLNARRLLLLPDLHLLPKEAVGYLGSALEKIPPLTTLAITTESLSKNTAFYKSMEKQGIILEMGEEKAWEKQKYMVEWLMASAVEKGQKVAPDALEFLAQGVGGSWVGLMNEWEKLTTFAIGEALITAQHVKNVCCLTQSVTGWALAEAILDQDFKKAFRIITQLLQQGEALFSILRQVRSQLMTSLQILSLTETGQGEKIELKWPYLKGSLLHKQIAAAKKYGERRLIEALEVLDKVEFKAKDTWDKPEVAAAYLLAVLT